MQAITAGVLPRPTPASGRLVVGVLEGEGIGPEVVGVALRVLKALQAARGRAFELRLGGAIGAEAEARGGAALSEEVAEFCRSVFADGGAVLAGPGSGRFVYELRRRFELFCKLTPIKPCVELVRSGRLKPEYVRDVDLVILRDNLEGVYQGTWEEGRTLSGERRAAHAFSYSEPVVRRLTQVAAAIAQKRRGCLSVVVKDGGVPSISRLWRDCAAEEAGARGVSVAFLNADYAAYLLVQSAAALDVVAAPNLFGDVLGDLGAVLLGSRGLAFSGSFSAQGAAVYQTNHGAALDLAGQDRANPAGQVLALAMLLRESFGLLEDAALVEAALAQIWRDGWRTEDLSEPGCRTVGTRRLGELMLEALERVGARVRTP